MEGVVEIRSFAWIVEDYPLLLACSFKLRLPRHLICNAPCLQILKIIHNSAHWAVPRSLMRLLEKSVFWETKIGYSVVPCLQRSIG